MPETQADDHLARIWQRAYRAKTRTDLEELYADWAATYDADHDSIGFFGHRRAAEVLARYVPSPAVAQVLDAGCGTGAAAEALRPLGFGNLSGIDLSAEMLARAEQKNLYRFLQQVDLGLPLDTFPCSHFDAAVLVGVFSFGQAPAHTLDEIVRLVKPGGVVVFTMRTDFFETDAMGVRSQMEQLDLEHSWKLVEMTDPEQYLPKKDPEAMFRVWCYRVLETKVPPVDEHFAEAVRVALSDPDPVKPIAHSFIWNPVGSRLYERYTDCPDYYLTDTEIEILDAEAEAILGDAELLIELGCGSAKKVSRLIQAAQDRVGSKLLTYTPVDISAGALESNTNEIRDRFGAGIQLEPRCGRIEDVLASIPVDARKLIVFFGGSIGNLEDLEQTVVFLRGIRERMSPQDRLLIGMDLDKDPAVLRAAYEAGEPNRTFFLNMIRRINHELGGNFDLAAFRQASPYLEDAPYEGIQTRSVRFRLINERPQHAYIQALHMEVEMAAGEAIQVGNSRKFRQEEIQRLAELAGLDLRQRWLDGREYFALCEFGVRPEGS